MKRSSKHLYSKIFWQKSEAFEKVLSSVISSLYTFGSVGASPELERWLTTVSIYTRVYDDDKLRMNYLLYLRVYVPGIQ